MFDGRRLIHFYKLGATERRDDGISDFGVAIIERMNKVGMALDVSHCGDRTTLDAFEISKKPVLITQANCRALVQGHPRVKTDEAIKKVGASGGVMGITAVRRTARVAVDLHSRNLIGNPRRRSDLARKRSTCRFAAFVPTASASSLCP
ncbi:MAG: membrane dipeptidase [Pyrinomonadaceae bacterium]